MPKFVVTYHLTENRVRGAAGGFGSWAGPHNALIEAESLADAMRVCPEPADDCYRIELAPINTEMTGGGE